MKIDYAPLYAFAEANRVSYNELCAAVRAALSSGAGAPAPEPTETRLIPGWVVCPDCDGAAERVYNDRNGDPEWDYAVPCPTCTKEPEAVDPKTVPPPWPFPKGIAG